MSGAAIVVAINIAVAGLFCIAFLIIALNHRRSSAATWFALGYGCAIVYFLFEFLLPAQRDPRLVYMGGFIAFLLALCCLVIGMARRYRVAVPWTLLGVTLSLGLIANWAGLSMERASVFRQLAYQAPYGVCSLLGAAIVMQSRQRGWLDRMLLGLMGVSAVYYLSKPLLAGLFGGVGARPQAYADTIYALYSQGSGAVLAVATGLVGLSILTRDMLDDATEDSRSDRLTGLLTRRGFEDQVQAALAVPEAEMTALIVCDINALQRVNATFGHERGDRVIARFAAHLREQAPEGAIGGRLGGEEFAVLLPGSSLVLGRLYAEAARAAFSGAPIDGLEAGHFTASFGVTARRRADDLQSMLRRAETALSEAKAAGRDRVHIDAQIDRPVSGARDG